MIAFIVVSDEPTTAQTLDEYGLRFDIERCAFSTKNRAALRFTSATSLSLKRLSRLLLILALATLYLTSLGVSGDQGRQASALVDPHWQRRLSYMQLGWRWRGPQASRGWQAFAPFGPGIAPDPLPMLTPPRGVIRESHEVDLSTAA